MVTSQHQLTPTATGAPARAGVRGCLPPMDAEPSSSRGQDPAVCRAGHPPRGGSSASAVNVMWRGGAVRCSPLLGHWWDPPEPPPPAGPGPDGSHASRRRLRARPRRRRPHRDTVVIRTAGQRRQHAAYPESLCFGVTRAARLQYGTAARILPSLENRSARFPDSEKRRVLGKSQVGSSAGDNY